jgi:hypothetical protein
MAGYNKKNLTITQYVNYADQSGLVNAIYFDEDDSFDAGEPNYFVPEDFGAARTVQNITIKVYNSDVSQASEYKYNSLDGTTTLITAL